MTNDLTYTTVDGWKRYTIPEKLCEVMLAEAEAAYANCYPAESTKKYSVAVLTEQGNVYPGISYGSDTETLTMHAEATGLAHAVLHGESQIIAITGPNCHTCKQLIWENGRRTSIDIVIIIREDGQIKQVPISDLMPYPWPDKKETF